MASLNDVTSTPLVFVFCHLYQELCTQNYALKSFTKHRKTEIFVNICRVSFEQWCFKSYFKLGLKSVFFDAFNDSIH